MFHNVTLVSSHAKQLYILFFLKYLQKGKQFYLLYIYYNDNIIIISCKDPMLRNSSVYNI